MSTNDLQKRLAALSPQQRELLLQRLGSRSQRDRHAAGAPRIERVARSEPLPLSFGQERLWFLHQLDPSAAYTISGRLCLYGALSRSGLGRALTRLVERHEILRTTFSCDCDGRPRQRVSPPSPVPVPLIDLRNSAGTAPKEVIARLASEHAREPFDLERGPLLRVQLVRCAPEEHVLLVAMHHIVADEWSLAIFVRELSVLYEAELVGTEASLAPLSIQFADYASWQRRTLTQERLDVGLAYWRQRLAALQPLELPRLQPSGPVDHASSRLSFSLSSRVLEKVRALGREEQATLFATTLTAFTALLMRTSGQGDICVGTPVANRSQTDVASLIGFFVDTLALRTELNSSMSFREALRCVRETILTAFAHQEVPFDRIVEALRPERRLDHSPLFEVFFALEQRLEPPVFTGLRAEPEQTDTGTAKFDLSLRLCEHAETLTGELESRKARIAPETAATLVAHFTALCEAVADNPEQPIGSIPLLSERERALLPDPRAPLADLALTPVVDTVLAMTERRGDVAAVSYVGRTWSYRELGTQARLLASRLVTAGVAPGQVVAVTGERSFGLIVAILGVMASGAVLLLIDPRLPEQRRALMLRETRARWLVACGDTATHTSRALLGVTDSGALSTVRVDAQTGTLAGAAAADTRPPLPILKADDPAYIFFTSGTSGRPKAVVGTHKGLSHFVAWERSRFGARDGDRVGLLIGLSFDAVLRDLFVPLTGGGVLCLPPPDAGNDGRQLLPWIDAERLTLVHTVPALLESWLTSFRRATPPGAATGAAASAAAHTEEATTLASVRFLLVAGEPLHDHLVQRWRSAFPLCGALVNLYGSTETTMIKFFHVVPATPRAGVQLAGEPLPKTQALIVNSLGQRCGIGEVGEIVVRTPYRTLGYLTEVLPDGRVKAGPAPFRQSPFTSEATDLVYPSGDRGRYDASGLLEVLGRLDDQVKIRGVRVDPGEVTSVLRGHPGLETAAVCALLHPRGELALVAYYVPRAVAPTAAELLGYCRAHLPAEMVPAAFVAVAALPLGPNGKLDRRALPAPCFGAAGETSAAAPQTPVEEALTLIWQHLLSLAHVGIDDNFFALGGHSLAAVQLRNRIEEVFGTSPSLGDLFELQTVRAQAQFLQTQSGATRSLASIARCYVRAAAGGGSFDEELERLRSLLAREALDLPPHAMPRADRSGRLPLASEQERLWFLHQLDPAAYNIPASVRLRGTLDAAAVTRAYNEILRRHEVLRSRFVSDNGRPYVFIAPPDTQEVPLVDLCAVPARELEARLTRLAATQLAQPFDLAHGPLVRCLLARLAADDHLLMVTMHHVVSDQASIAIFMRELSAAYGAARAGHAVDLPTATVQYVDYAAWQRAKLAAGAFAADLGYWRTRLADLPTLRLPGAQLSVDASAAGTGRDLRRAPPPEPAAAVTHRFELPREMTVGLRALCHEHEVTPFALLVAAVSVVLGRYTGETDIVIGTPVTARNRPELESLIGLFANTMVLRTDLSGNPPFTDLLARVRERLREALSHRELPYAELVRALNPERRHDRTPLFQVMLVYDREQEDRLELPGLTIEPGLELDRQARFDLSIVIGEHQDRLSGRVTCNPARCDPTLAAKLPRHLSEVLRHVLAAPATRVAELRLLTAEERAELAELGRPKATATARDRIHDRIRVQALRHPEALAVVDAQRHISYQELFARAERLAATLRAAGVGREHVVGLMLPPSCDLIVGIVGVLLAGGAYLILDFEQPEERRAFQLCDSQAACLVVGAGGSTRLANWQGRILALDEATTSATPTRTADVGLGEATPAAAAYMVYTSGSTGQPKGIIVEHRNVLAYVDGLLASGLFPVGASCAVVTTLAADLAYTMLFGALCTGGTLHLLGRELALDPLRLAAYLARHAVEVMKTVPSHMEALLAGDGLCVPRRLLMLGGEALSLGLVERLRARGARCEIVNHYGPAEATIGASVYKVPAELDVDASATVPIGRPLPHVSIQVLDAHGQPVPVGVVGELIIGGGGVARGYHDRPALTRERFVADPSREAEGGRLYKSGDLVRYLNGGDLEFIGRRDQQIKLRGHRIELGEVEATLRQHPSIRDAVVATRDDHRAGPHLVAYVVGPGLDEAAPSSGLEVELTSFLRARLPAIMVPRVYVVLPRLPTNAAGKLDRKALPAPKDPDPTAPVPGAPRTQTERVLADAWCAVLDLPAVDVHANFFDLGGDSRASIEVVSRARAQIPSLTVGHIFEHQTIATIARALDADADADADAGAGAGAGADAGADAGGAAAAPPQSATTPALAAAHSHAASPGLTPIQAWYLNEQRGDPHFSGLSSWNQTSILTLSPEVDPTRLERAFTEVARCHEALRLRFRATRDGWQPEVLAPTDAAIAFATLDWSQRATDIEPALSDLAAQQQSTLDSERGPVCAVTVVRLGTQRSPVAVVSGHHLIWDTHGALVLGADLAQAYRQLTLAQPVTLAPAPESFLSWSERLSRYGVSPELLQDVGYWLDAKWSAVSPLPLDLWGPNDQGSAEVVTHRLSRDVTQALRQEGSRAYGASMEELWLAALAHACHDWQNGEAWLCDRHHHGRVPIGGVDLSRTVGWCATMAPLLIAPTSWEWADLVRAVRAAVRGMPWHGVTYAVARFLGPQPLRERLAALPRAPIHCNYVGEEESGGAARVGAEGNVMAVGAEPLIGIHPRDGHRPYPLEVRARVSGGELQWALYFSSNLHRRETITRLCATIAAALDALVVHCRAAAAATPPRAARAHDRDRAQARDASSARGLRRAAMTLVTDAGELAAVHRFLDTLDRLGRVMAPPLFDPATLAPISFADLRGQWERRDLVLATERTAPSGDARIIGVDLLYRWPHLFCCTTTELRDMSSFYEHVRVLHPSARGKFDVATAATSLAILDAAGIPLERMFGTIPCEPFAAERQARILAHVAAARGPAHEERLFHAIMRRDPELLEIMQSLRGSATMREKVLGLMRSSTYGSLRGRDLLDLPGKSPQAVRDALLNLVQPSRRAFLIRRVRYIMEGHIRLVGFELRLLEPMFVHVEDVDQHPPDSA